MIEFTINNYEYRTKRMDAFKQLHVSRRILPLLAKIPEMLGLTLEDILTAPDDAAKAVTTRLNNINLDVIADGLVGLKQDDVDYILNTCLEHARIKDGKGAGWAPVMRNGDLMYDHIGMREMIGIAFNVIKDNLGGFFGGSAPTSTAADGATATKSNTHPFPTMKDISSVPS